jgi:glycosyl transferase family 2
VSASPPTPEPSTTTLGRRRPGAPLRVLVVTPSGDPGGDGDGVLRLVAVTHRLQPTVHRVGPGGQSQEPGTTGRAASGMPPVPRAGRALADTFRLRAVLRSLDPDVVLVDGPAVSDAALPAAFLTGHRVVYVRDRSDPQLPTWLARLASAVITTSPTGPTGTAGGPTPLPSPGVPLGLGADGAELRGAAHQLAGVLAETVGRPGAGIDPADGPPMSVVVPVFREGALVDDLVAALLPQLRPDDELVVVDDGSPDDTGERAERAAARHPQVRAVRQSRNAGAGAARNSGVAVARHAHIAFTDAGCHWGDGWLDGMRIPFTEVPSPDLVAGAYRVSRRTVFEAASAVGCYPDVAEVRRAGPLTTAWSLLFGRRFDPTRPAGRSIAVTRRALDAVGGWPEDIRVHEDLDLSRSIAERGLRCVLTTDADLVWDQAGVRGTTRMYVRYGRGDAEATDRQALVRDVARAVAYVVGAVGLGVGGTRVRAALALGAAAYVGVPLSRARREERPVATATLVPAVIVGRDLAKVWGVLQVGWERAVRNLRQR